MANPFGQARELMKMQKEAKAMQKKLRSTLVTGKSKDNLVSFTLNGAQELEDVVISSELLNENGKRQLIKGIKQAYKSAQKELQKSMMKDMDLDKLKGLLGS